MHQAIWLKNLVSKLKAVDSTFRPLVIYYDNKAVVFYSKNNTINNGSTHIDIKYLAFRELVKKSKI